MILAGVVVGGIIGWMAGGNEVPIISTLSKRAFDYRRTGETVRMGFLPSLMIGKTREYCKEIDRMVFLGVEIRESGEIIWDSQSKKIDSEAYRSLSQKFRRCGGKNILGIKLFDDEKIEKLIKDEAAITKMIDQVRRVTAEKKFDGVNVDFEYMNDPTAVLEDEFIEMIGRIRQAGVEEVSVDVFANTLIKGDGVGLKKLIGAVDYLVVMAYDFHGPKSGWAGPVAPIGAVAGERNIAEVAEKIKSGELERGKIILAWPLYGYEWVTVDENFGSKAVRYEGMWSYRKTAEATLAGSYGEKKWDELSQTPWISWKEKVRKSKSYYEKVKGKWVKKTEEYNEDEVHQLYHENERSLTVKMELAKELEVGG